MAKNNEFSAKVRDIVRGIKRGSTLSYKEVATRAGNPKASRAVAMIMSRNHDVTVPCHRVICSNGSLGGYNNGGTQAKEKILKGEGITLNK
ncbi:MAG: MGMT family protein [Candidatus Kaiserbacteria bacterium]|nr:MGMT family protein [Candidatus Kaiserbacteria bacterium]